MAIGRHMDDLLRKRIDDVLSKSSRESDVAVGEWLDPDVRLPYESARWPSQVAAGADRGAIDRGLSLSGRLLDGMQSSPASLRPREHQDSASPLDRLRHETDWRGGPADFRMPSSATPEFLAPSTMPEFGPRQPGDSISVDREALFAFLAERGIRSPISDRDAARAVRQESHSSFARVEAPADLLRRDGMRDDPSKWLHGVEGRAPEGAGKPLDAIARQLDELAREVNTREGGASSDEIEAFKERLATLARRTEVEAERKLRVGGDDARLPDAPLVSAAFAGGSLDTILHGADRYRRLEARPPRIEETDEAHDDDDAGRSIEPVSGKPDGGYLSEAFESELATILKSVAQQRQLEHQAPSEDIPIESDAPALATADQLVVASPERRLVRPTHETEQSPVIPERLVAPTIERRPRPVRTAQTSRKGKKNPARSTVMPMVRAGLAAVLALAVVVTGAYFARSRMDGAFFAKPAITIVHEPAPVLETAAAGPLTIMPPNSVARFQDLVFPLPRLYGIYAINSGRLFELDALPGQAPDPRVAVSAAIPRPSRTTLPEGRVAFLLFRRDMASSIAERVQLRVVARVKRAAAGADEQDTASADSWTIRNIAIDFRVAPVEHNKEMVLLVSEKPDFTLPAGRYALILKGQAYDFTVAGPVTDPAQCLERVEAANGGFYHLCQPAQPKGAEVSALDEAPAVTRAPSKARRGELHARR